MTTAQDPTTQEKNKAVLRKLAEAFTNHDVRAFEEIYSPNVAYHGTGDLASADRKTFVDFASQFMEAFPDGRVTVDDLISADDKVAYRMTVTGTHKVELMGIPATNKHVTIRAIGIARVSGDHIVEEWENFDDLGMLQQLGVMPNQS
jgi:steroid delta-isomerase-like uncharacterized protein